DRGRADVRAAVRVARLAPAVARSLAAPGLGPGRARGRTARAGRLRTRRPPVDHPAPGAAGARLRADRAGGGRLPLLALHDAVQRGRRADRMRPWAGRSRSNDVRSTTIEISVNQRAEPRHPVVKPGGIRYLPLRVS